MAPWVHRHGLLLVKQDRGSDHDRARDAVSAGDVLPLQQILRCLGRDRQERWIYRLKLLVPGDQAHRLIVDAQSGQVLQSKRRQGCGCWWLRTTRTWPGNCRPH